MRKIIDFFYKILKKTELTAEEEREVVKKIIKKIKEN